MKTLTAAKQHDLRRDRFLTATDAIVLERAVEITNTSLWTNAQRDGRPAEYRWRRLFNAAKFG